MGARSTRMTEFATATAVVAEITLGIDNAGRESVGVVTDGDSDFILGGLLLGNVKCTGESLVSESKFSSFLTELSSVLDAEEMPESGDVGLS